MLVLTGLGLVAVALVACYIPARRPAAKSDLAPLRLHFAPLREIISA